MITINMNKAKDITKKELKVRIFGYKFLLFWVEITEEY